jgi:DMSO/TMAO reductase YedYZ molybdopterin-dependent catalytic subunit
VAIFRRDRVQDPRVVADPRRLPAGQVLTDKWPVLTYGGTPRYDMAKWRLHLDGEVENPVVLTWDQVRQLPSRRSRPTCTA